MSTQIYQTNLFVYTRFNSRNINSFQVIAKNKCPHIHTSFSSEVKMVEILTDLNWK